MKSWMEERDLLIAQTMAFLEDVAAAVPIRAEPPTVAAKSLVAAPIENAERPIEVEPVAVSPQPIARLIPHSALGERAEILKRVTSFKDHQARFLQDRDTFFRAAMTRIGDSAGGQGKGKPM